jgi:hypothetical protein
MSAYIKKSERMQINNILIHFKLFEKQQVKPQISRWKEKIKIRAEINGMETKTTIYNQ